jgi:cytochrome c oxidase cbb3-type subunit 1
MTMASMYSLVPRLWGRDGMYSTHLINVHFWIATLGIVLYIASMWIAGVMQGLMWREVDANGSLVYSHVESIEATFPYYVIRIIGGVLFFIGILIQAYNTWKTIKGAPSPEARANQVDTANAVGEGA